MLGCCRVSCSSPLPLINTSSHWLHGSGEPQHQPPFFTSIKPAQLLFFSRGALCGDLDPCPSCSGNARSICIAADEDCSIWWRNHEQGRRDVPQLLLEGVQRGKKRHWLFLGSGSARMNRLAARFSFSCYVLPFFAERSVSRKL